MGLKAHPSRLCVWQGNPGPGPQGSDVIYLPDASASACSVCDNCLGVRLTLVLAGERPSGQMEALDFRNASGTAATCPH